MLAKNFDGLAFEAIVPAMAVVVAVAIVLAIGVIVLPGVADKVAEESFGQMLTLEDLLPQGEIVELRTNKGRKVEVVPFDEDDEDEDYDGENMVEMVQKIIADGGEE